MTGGSAERGLESQENGIRGRQARREDSRERGMSGGDRTRGLEVEEVARLYGSLAGRLRGIVRGRLSASCDADVEDACQVAWGRLVVHRSRVGRDTALGWLAVTAQREALRQAGRRRLELLVERPPEGGQHDDERPARRAPLEAVAPVDDVVEARLRLASIEALPARQRRLVWLQGLGLSYEEMARCTGASRRSVERQLLRAKQVLREAA